MGEFFCSTSCSRSVARSSISGIKWVQITKHPSTSVCWNTLKKWWILFFFFLWNEKRENKSWCLYANCLWAITGAILDPNHFRSSVPTFLQTKLSPKVHSNFEFQTQVLASHWHFDIKRWNPFLWLIRLETESHGFTFQNAFSTTKVISWSTLVEVYNDELNPRLIFTCITTKDDLSIELRKPFNGLLKVFNQKIGQ